MHLLLLFPVLIAATARFPRPHAAAAYWRRSLSDGEPVPFPTDGRRLAPRAPQWEVLTLGVQAARMGAQMAAKEGAQTAVKEGVQAAAKEGAKGAGKAAEKEGIKAGKKSPSKMGKNMAQQNQDPLLMHKASWNAPDPKTVGHKPGDAIKRLEGRLGDPDRKTHMRAVGQEIGKAIVGGIIPGLDMVMPKDGKKGSPVKLPAKKAGGLTALPARPKKVDTPAAPSPPPPPPPPLPALKNPEAHPVLAAAQARREARRAGRS